jgi:hypothetical protein
MATATETARTSAATEPCAWPTLDTFEEGTRRVRRALVDARHTAEDVAADARLTVRRHPITSVAAGMAAGAFVGAACGIAVALFARRDR